MLPFTVSPKKPITSIPVDTANLPSYRRIGVFIAAAFCFLAINVFIGNFSDHSSKPRSFDLSSSDTEQKAVGKIASWWLAKAYFAEPKPPDIVVFGNSQLAALRGADAYVYHRLIDLTDDNRSYTLEHDLQMLLHKQWRTSIIALPGAMLSDQLVISRALFSGEYKPKLVVVTFSPRDFIDNTCPSVNSTEAFAFFSKYADLGSDSALFHIDQKSISAKDLPRLLPLRNLFRDIFAFEDPCLQSSTRFKYRNNVTKALAMPFERICPGEVTIDSGDWYTFNDNTEGFRRRYKNPISASLKLQMRCLDALLSYLAQRHIKVVAFDLPSTTANRKLLPDKFWQLYTQHIVEICKKNGADFIDINNDWKAFNDKDFMDSIHLNLPGGLKLTRPIALFTANKFHEVDFAELRRREHKMF